MNLGHPDLKRQSQRKVSNMHRSNADLRAYPISRRAVVAGGASLGVSAVAGLSGPASAASSENAAESRVVETKKGKLSGRSHDGILSFKGIRYGEDTSKRRFKSAQPVKAWTGIREATAYGAQSPQLLLPIAGMGLLIDFYLPQPESEDCLFLNVWAPDSANGSKRPVMVWLHGGAFIAGSGASPVYDGTRLCARNDVVLVTLNHRLGAFGYLNVADIGGEEYRDSGNVGNLDIILALKWVRDNISAFGGDPENVTIFGESGGGYKVSTLMAMPAAKGLFHKAIIQSGPLLFAHSGVDAADYTRRFMKTLGLPPGDLEQLTALAPSQITGALQQSVGDLGWRFGPVIDGRNLPGHPFDPDAPPFSADVPLLIGANKDEAALTADPATFAMTRDELLVRLKVIHPGKDADKLATGLASLHPFASPGELYITAASWVMMRNNTIIQAERKAAAGKAPAYMYLLNWETPVDGGKWKSPHALDLPLVFDNVASARSMLGEGGQAQRVADAMSRAWTSFARSGSPGWPNFEPEQWNTMVFDASSRLERDPYAGERALLGGAPTPSPAG